MYRRKAVGFGVFAPGLEAGAVGIMVASAGISVFRRLFLRTRRGVLLLLRNNEKVL